MTDDQKDILNSETVDEQFVVDLVTQRWTQYFSKSLSYSSRLPTRLFLGRKAC